MTEINNDQLAIVGFILGLMISVIWLTQVFVIVTFKVNLFKLILTYINKNFILLPSLSILLLPFISARIFYTIPFIGKNWNILPNPIIGAIVGGTIGFASSYFMWQAQTRYARRNMAWALYQEILVIESKFQLGGYQAIIKSRSGSDIQPIIIKQPIYTYEKSFFNICAKEILFFNEELSKMIHEFFMALEKAETYRRYGEEKRNIYSSAQDDEWTTETLSQAMEISDLSKEMTIKISEAYILLPRLKELLEKEANTTPFL